MFVNNSPGLVVNVYYDFAMVDLDSIDHRIGETYEGFVYAITIYTELVSDFASQLDEYPDCSGCTIACPKDTCLSACPWNAVDDPTCSPCNDDCEKGCISQLSCNLCQDSLCKTCEEIGSNECIECVESAEFIDGACVCRPPSVLYAESCIFCHESCKYCFGTAQHQCTDCAEGYVSLERSSICVD